MKKLEVGMTFDVVEITQDCDYKVYGDSYKLGGHTLLKDKWLVLENGVSGSGNYYAFDLNHIPKRIGRLTIKYVK